jgi:Sec-independent protein translocase protein TatA
MSILGFLFLVFVCYLGYRLVFDFILPVYRTTRRIKNGFREMNQRMKQHTGQSDQQPNPSKQQQSTSKASHEDYIDFEEIKD